MKIKAAISLLIFGSIFVSAITQRLEFSTEMGRDTETYVQAITEFFSGKSPYINTIKSFKEGSDSGGHGYAYLPGILYLYGGLFLVYLKTGIAYQVLWKIPVLAADVGVGLLLVTLLYRKSWWATLGALLFWFFNPYNFTKDSYTYFDPIPIFFLLVSLYFLGKDDVLTGAFYALAIVFKSYPVFLLPVFLLLSKKRIEFLAAGLLTGSFLLIPFMGNLKTFTQMLQGAFFVHSDRVVQGRPFLFYISYFYNIELFQIIPITVYSTLAMFGGWVVGVFSYFVLKIREKYLLSLLVFLNFYLFTPVFNRTYVLWFLPVLILGLFNGTKKKWVYYVVLVVVWLFFYWYLKQWKDGFDVWKP